MKTSLFKITLLTIAILGFSILSFAQTRADLQGIMNRYSNYNMRIANNPADNTKEIQRLSFLFPQYRNAAIPTSKKLILIMVEDRLITSGRNADVNKLKKKIERYKRDLERENFAPVVIQAKVYDGNEHQDGATVLAMRAFFKSVKNRFSKFEGAVFIGSFPEATIVRQILWNRESSEDILKIKIGDDGTKLMVSPPWLHIRPGIAADRADLVLADLDGNWANIYKKARQNVESIAMAPIPSQRNNFFTNNKVVISKRLKYEKTTKEFRDFFFVKDADYTCIPTNNDDLKVRIRLAELDPELSRADRASRNSIAQPEICISRINARNIAVKIRNEYRNQLLDGRGKPKSTTLNIEISHSAGLFEHDLALEYKLLNEYLDRNHRHRTGKTSDRAKRVAIVTDNDFQTHAERQVNWFKPVAKGFHVSKKFKNADLVKYVDFLKEPAVLKGIAAHSFATYSNFNETSAGRLNAAVGSEKWFWKNPKDTKRQVNGFPNNHKRADFYLYRSLYENDKLRNAGASFYYHNGCQVNSPVNANRNRYNNYYYAYEQNAESILFYANGLAIITRAKTFNDAPDVSGNIFMQRWNVTNLGYAMRSFQKGQARNTSNKDGSNHVVRNKRSYPWGITGDWTLKAIYPNISSEKKYQASISGKKPMIAGGDFDNDSNKEIILGTVTNNNNLAVIVYNGYKMNKRIGDIRIDGKAIAIAAGNFDNDAKDELVVASLEDDHKIKIRVYDARMSGSRIVFTEKGSLNLEGKTVSVAAGNFDNDAKDELVIGMLGKDKRLAVLVYDVKTAGNRWNLNTRIGDYRFEGNSIQVAAGNLDPDNKDEIVIASTDNSNKIEIKVHDAKMQGNRLNIRTQIANKRITGRLPSLSVGNFDNDNKDEIIVSTIDQSRKAAIMVYNPKPNGNRLNLVRIKDARLSGRNPVVSGASFVKSYQAFLVGFGNTGNTVKLEMHKWIE